MDQDSRGGLVFDGQRAGEQIIIVKRQHPWVLARVGLFVSLIISIIIVSVYLFKASPLTSWIIFGGGLATLGWGSYVWYGWWNTIVILTNERILLIDQRGLLSRTVSEVPVPKIQDVSFTTKGLFQTLLNYGAVAVKTASSEDVMRIPNVSNPYHLHQEIMKVAQKTWSTPHQT
jgi:uncharacterized membrane protein YdbT with pleckstrin-like domain